MKYHHSATTDVIIATAIGDTRYRLRLNQNTFENCYTCFYTCSDIFISKLE